jgi:hypothetical protein
MKPMEKEARELAFMLPIHDTPLSVFKADVETIRLALLAARNEALEVVAENADEFGPIEAIVIRAMKEE